MKQLDEILNKLHWENIAHINGSHSSNDVHVQEAKQAIQALIEDIIGEDLYFPAGRNYTQQEARSQLRKEQRAKLKELKGE
jgi:hypothetical protein